MDAAGSVDAAVLVPIYGWPADPGLIFAERRHDLRRHAGEISFPGGPQRGRRATRDGALREAEEEIGLDRGRVDVVGARASRDLRHELQGPPCRGADRDGPRLRSEPGPAEVETVLAFGLARRLGTGFAMRRLVRRGSDPHAYLRGCRHLIWGATAQDPRRADRPAAGRGLTVVSGAREPRLRLQFGHGGGRGQGRR